MKATILNHAKTWAGLLTLTLLAAVAGCSDDDNGGGGTGVDESVVSISTIILTPRSTQPEDTLVATVVVEGYAAPGQIPTLQWTAEDGSFVANNQVSVDWVAPQTPGVYRLTCKATGGESSDEHHIDVFVGNPTMSVTDYAGEVKLAASPSFYYLHSVPLDEAWDSASVYVKTAGDPAPVVTSQIRGAQFAFSSGASRAAYVVNTTGDLTFTLEPLAIYVAELNAGTHRMITTDRAASNNFRRHQFRYPYFSRDENWVTYQGYKTTSQTGGVDTLDIYIYNLLTDEETVVTESDIVRLGRRNLYPTFSTDLNWVVYVSETDSVQRDLWDLYGRRIQGGNISADRTRLTTGGLIGLNTMSLLGRPIQQWNPSQPIVAVVGGAGSDGGLHLVTTSGSGATTVDVRECGDGVKEVTWTTDGQALAVAAVVPADGGGNDDVDAIFTVTAAGVATRRHSARVGDLIVDLEWSHDGKFVLYRVIRFTESWFELLDIDGGTNFTEPVAISPSLDIGWRGDYASQMSTASAYGPDNVVRNILFDANLSASGTPTIWSLDLTPAVQP